MDNEMPRSPIYGKDIFARKNSLKGKYLFLNLDKKTTGIIATIP